MTGQEPDMETFPLLASAYSAIRRGGAAPAVLNAANEVAVGQLLQSERQEDMPVGRIFDTVEEVLSRVGHLPANTLEEVLEADRLAREAARAFLKA